MLWIARAAPQVARRAQPCRQRLPWRVASLATVRSSQLKLSESGYAGPRSVRLAAEEECRGERPEHSGRPQRLAHATNAVCERGRAGDYGGALELFRKVDDPDDVLRNAVLSVCAKGALVRDAWQIWEAFPVGERTHVSYGAMLDVCKRAKRSRMAERLMKEMSAASLEPDVIHYTSLIAAYSMAGEASKAVEVFESIRATLLAASTAANRRMVYQVTMSATARVGDYAATRELFIKMTEDQVQPDQLHFNALMTACASQGSADTAEAVFETMGQWGLAPRVEDYTILLSCNRHNLQRCRGIFADMRAAQIRPTSKAHQALFRAHVLCKDGAGARKLLSEATGMDREGLEMRRLLAELAELP